MQAVSSYVYKHSISVTLLNYKYANIYELNYFTSFDYDLNHCDTYHANYWLHKQMTRH